MTDEEIWLEIFKVVSDKYKMTYGDLKNTDSESKDLAETTNYIYIQFMKRDDGLYDD